MSVYSHGDKAGNRADVWKHFVLLSLVRELVERRAFLGDPIHYVESHAGAGRYPLIDGGAWEEGAGRLLAAVPEALRAHPYLRLLDAALHPEAERPAYPGSWYLVGQYLDSEVVPYTMALYETGADGDADPGALLCAELEAGRLWPGVSVQPRDGFAGVAGHTDAHLIFLDPAYAPRARGDWDEVGRAARCLAAAGAGFLIWYPLLAGSAGGANVDALYASAGAACGAELQWAPGAGVLSGCGMLGAGALAPALADYLETGAGELAALAEALGGQMHGRAS